MTKKVIITAQVHPILPERLEAHGYSIDYRPEISYQELLAIVPEAEGLIVTTRIEIDKQMINAATRLAWIGRLGSGMELIDAEYAALRGINCISTPEGNRGAVAEHTLALVLNLLNHISRSQDEVRKRLWRRNENRGTELAGKTVGIVGYGNTGSAFAKLLQPFGATVLAYDKYKDGFGGGYIKEAQLDHIAKYADVISFHLPLTPQTANLANEEFFTSLKQSPVVINTCRGEIVNTGALIKALNDGKVSAAGLDVLENEKINSLTNEQESEFQILIAHPDVIVTPHIAGYSHEAFRRMSEVLLKKLGL